MVEAEDSGAQEGEKEDTADAFFRVGAEEIEDVFHGGEAETDDTAVDEAVHRAVDFAAQEEQEDQQRQRLHALFRQRRDHRSAQQVVGELVGAEGDDGDIEDEFKDQGQNNRRDCAPKKGGDQQRQWLFFVAVEPPEHQRVEEHRYEAQE